MGVAPGLAAESLNHIGEALRDEDGSVRLAALEAMGNLVLALPNLAATAVSLVATALQNGPEDVPPPVLGAVWNLVETSPDLASDCLPHVVGMLQDGHRGVQLDALRTRHSSCAASPVAATQTTASSCVWSIWPGRSG